MRVHLNYNGISFDEEFMLEIIELFGMSKKDIPNIKFDRNDEINQ
jgi:hypothetical protein